MSNESAVFVAKDMDRFLLLIYALGQLGCFFPAWCIKTDFNQFIKGILTLISKLWLHIKTVP